MEYCFKIEKSEKISLPDECFVCGSKSEATYPLIRFQITHIGLGLLKPSVVMSKSKLNAPICLKHLRRLIIYKIFYYLLVLICISMIFINNINLYLFGLFAMITYFIGKEYIRINNSFKIYSIDGDGKIVYSSNREEYLQKISALNEIKIFKRDFFTGADY